MNVNLELYRIFNAVAQEKSFSGAAKSLYISQPAVSQAMRQLEDACGTRLFSRGARGVTLTPEGETLNGYIRSAMSMISAGESKLTELTELAAGELRIGAGDTVSKWYLLPVIRRFHERYPEVKLRITNRTSSETVTLLRDGKIDIGFVNMPISAPGVMIETCHDVHDVFLAGETFSYMRGKKITLAELSSKPLIMLERSSNSRRWVDRHFQSSGVELQPEIELGAHDLVLDYGSIGLGISCCIKEFSQRALEDENMFVLDLEKPVPPRSVGACYLSSIGLSTAARKFIDLVKSENI